MDKLEAEHPGLMSGTVDILQVLRDAERFGAAMVDFRYCRRAQRLAGVLDSAGILIAADQMAGAFTILRTALEHACVDRLLFNAAKRSDRYVAADDDWERRQRDAWIAGEVGTDDIESISRRGNDVYVVRGGHKLVNGEGTLIGRLSPYFAAMEHHSPFVGKPADQNDRTGVHTTLEERRVRATENREWWNRYLSWSAIKENLVLNNFYSDRDVRRLDVHYSFLSAFTHAHEDGYNTVDHSASREQCHFCRELAVIYIAIISASELRAVLEHCGSKVEEKDLAKLRDTLERVDLATAHLWFPPGSPSEWDRHQVVLQRQVESKQWDQRAVELNAITDDDVPYYNNPLQRLVSLHQSATEIMTRLTYASPWPHATTFHP